MRKELEALVESTAKMQCEFYYTFSWENAPEHIKLGCIQEARAILSQKGIYVEVDHMHIGNKTYRVTAVAAELLKGE